MRNWILTITFVFLDNALVFYLDMLLFHFFKLIFNILPSFRSEVLAFFEVFIQLVFIIFPRPLLQLLLEDPPSSMVSLHINQSHSHRFFSHSSILFHACHLQVHFHLVHVYKVLLEVQADVDSFSQLSVLCV